MIKTLKRTMLTIVVAIVLVSATGCTLTPGTNSDDDDASPQSWDLREPPTREQVGMKDDEDDVFALYDTDEPHQVDLKLPENTTLTLPLTLLTFNSPGLAPSDPQPPTSLDGKTDRVPLDETVELYRSTLDQLNMGTDTIADFQKQASAADGAQHPAKRITSQRVEKKYGYMRLQVLAQYEPDTQVGYIKISGVWGPTLKYGTSNE